MVLLLDDDEELLDVLQAVVNFGAGEEALCLRSYAELLERRDEVLRCDRAILDINLGAGVPNGVSAYRWLRQQGFASRISFLTGHAREEPAVADALRIRDACVIEKPAPMERLLRFLRGDQE